MDKCAYLVKRNNCFIEIIDKILTIPEKELIDISHLYPENDNLPYCKQCTLSMLAILNVFGVTEYKENEDKVFIKVISITGKYFLSSLSEYVRNNITLLSKWEEQKGKIPITNEVNMFYGPQFLYYMEKRRVDECPNASPIRHKEIVRVIIKARFHKTSKDMYLFQFDPKVIQYKTIGGVKEITDKTPLDGIKREIAEELPLSSLIYNNTYKLTLTNNETKRFISYTHGAYSEYIEHFYHAHSINPDCLKLGQTERWITIEEIKNGKTTDSVEIFPMTSDLITKMENLPPSVEYNHKEPLVRIAKRKWEAWQIIVGIVSLIATFGFGIYSIILAYK